MGEFDVSILDDTTAKLDVVYSIVKLNCHLTKPVLVLMGSISIAEENCIWGELTHRNGIMTDANAIIQNVLVDWLKGD